MLHIIKGAGTEVFLLTPDRYRWVVIKILMGKTELCDTRGIGRISEVYIFWMNRPCYASHVLISCIVELRDTVIQYQKSPKMTNRGDSDTGVPLRGALVVIQV